MRTARRLISTVLSGDALSLTEATLLSCRSCHPRRLSRGSFHFSLAALCVSGFYFQSGVVILSSVARCKPLAHLGTKYRSDSATTDHFLSPRAPSAARLEVESK